MECVEHNHIEPINLNRPQWWNQCPNCFQYGLNDADQEARHQVIERKEIDGRIVKVPLTKQVGDKKFVIVFKENTAQKDCICKACGHSFIKE